MSVNPEVFATRRRAKPAASHRGDPRSEVSNSQRKIPLSLPSARAVVDYLTGRYQVPAMALHFVSKKQIASIHSLYFNDPSPTDCITLCYKEPLFLGEVFVCPEIASEYIQEKGGDLSSEITLYVIHGFLHLIGYDDIKPKDVVAMRAQENILAAELAKKNLCIIPSALMLRVPCKSAFGR